MSDQLPRQLIVCCDGTNNNLTGGRKDTHLVMNRHTSQSTNPAGGRRARARLAAGAGIAAMPSYVSEIEDRLTPLTDIQPLSTVRFWLAYTERVRNMEASQPVLHWIRSCFDPARNPCFREVYVPPSRRARPSEVANDMAPAGSGPTRTLSQGGDDDTKNRIGRVPSAGQGSRRGQK